MSKLLLLACFLVCWINGVAQSRKYVLEFHFNGVRIDTPSVLVIRHDGGISKILIDKPIKEWVLDSIIFHPQSVQVDFYTNCSKDEIRQLLSIGGSRKYHLSANIFLIDSVQSLAIRKDSLFLLKPNNLQIKYQKAREEVSDRIESFNEKTNNALLKAYRLAKTKYEKDSIKSLASALFKVNVARVNLDSTTFPLIENNLDNSLSFYAMNEYIRVSRILKLPIPVSAMKKMLQSMPSHLKKFPNWEALNNTLNVIDTVKTFVGGSAPEFMQLYDTSGKAVYLKDFRGNIIFIDFWASWCLPCLAQLPKIKNIYNEVKSQEIVFIGISLDNSLNAWKQEIIKSRLDWINVSDLKFTTGLTAVAYGITTIPHNILIDKNGTIVGENVPLESLENEIRKLQTK